jgi:ESCRT-I complex subunit VPS28
MPKFERMELEGDQEIELYSNSRERQQYDEQANLFAIITATEHLERAYARDDLSREEVSF